MLRNKIIHSFIQHLKYVLSVIKKKWLNWTVLKRFVLCEKIIWRCRLFDVIFPLQMQYDVYNYNIWDSKVLHGEQPISSPWTNSVARQSHDASASAGHLPRWTLASNEATVGMPRPNLARLPDYLHFSLLNFLINVILI